MEEIKEDEIKIEKYIVSGEISHRIAVRGYNIEKSNKRLIEKLESGNYKLTMGNQVYTGELIHKKQNTITVDVNGNHYEFTIEKDSTHKRKAAQKEKAGPDTSIILKSPMPGKICEVFVTKDSTVRKGEPILILEAMKMQNQVLATTDAKVIQINVKEGDTVFGDQILIEMEAI